MFWDVLESLAILVEWISFFVVADNFSSKKDNKNYIYISFIGILVISLLLKALSINPNERIIIGFFIGLAFYKMYFKVNNIKCIIISLIFWLFMISVEALAISLVVKFNRIKNMNDILNPTFYRAETILLSKVILIFLIVLLKCLKLHIDIGKGEFIYILTPIITNIIMILIIFGYAFSGNQKEVDNTVSIFLLSILLLASNLSIMFIVGKIIKNNKLKLENEFIKNKMDMEHKYYSDLSANEERVKRLYHDMKNHIICIEGSDNNCNWKKEYIDNINSELDKFSLMFNTGNEALDIILNNKNGICIKNNIELRGIIDFSKIDFIEYFDVCTIFSNALDNAIEACKKVEEGKKYIILKGTYVNNFFIIKIENSKNNKIKKIDYEFLTDKKDKFLHGIGLKNIRSAVEKYDGEMIAESKEDKFILKILIPIKVKKPINN